MVPALFSCIVTGCAIAILVLAFRTTAQERFDTCMMIAEGSQILGEVKQQAALVCLSNATSRSQRHSNSNQIVVDPTLELFSPG
jgi:hypothetical protein